MTRRAAVIGSPISHSRSPAIFRFLAERLAMTDLVYEAREVRPEGLADFVSRDLRADSAWVGVNVTIPHKEKIAPLLDEVVPEARAVGAVNVVQRRGSRLVGHNTDVLGIEQSLERAGYCAKGKCAWVWGAGGAARAACFALGRSGANVVCVQGGARGDALCEEFARIFPGTRFVTSQAEPGMRYSLLINSTPLGMKGVERSRDGREPAEYFSDLGKLALERDALAFDLIYVPERTPFLELAAKRGLRTLGGLEMLLHQALATWTIWFGANPDPMDVLAELREHLRAAIALPERIFLTGFMASGKSTVGPALARRLGWDYVDTDERVSQEKGLSIPEFFARHGESEFRKVERQAVSEAALRPRAVIALGGGALGATETQEQVLGSGFVVFLEASVDEIQRRLGPSAASRPLLAGLSAPEQRRKIESLLEARLPAYRRAGLTVTTDGKAPEAIAEEILSAIRGKGER